MRKPGSHLNTMSATSIVGDYSNFLLEWLPAISHRSSATHENQPITSYTLQCQISLALGIQSCTDECHFHIGRTGFEHWNTRP